MKNQTKLDELFDRIQNLPIPSDYSQKNTLELGNILAQLIEEVKRIESKLERASVTANHAANVASCIANGIQPD